MAMFNIWLKKIGSKHYSEPGASTTLCGLPMLGNNYAKHREESTECTECLNKIRYSQTLNAEFVRESVSKN